MKRFYFALLTLPFLAPTAFAWDVRCTVNGQDCKDPFERVQTHWHDDPRAEHATLLKQSMGHAGLPSSLTAPFELTVYADDSTVTAQGASYPSINPVLTGPARERKRTVTIQSMANLPDFAYTLWDWSSGAELCPPNPASTDAVDCHNYETHIGWLNSNHMLPQSRRWYAHLHAIALDRARACKAAHDATPPGLRERYESYFLACERMALVFEAVGHHYLQDSWAMGHMWERWGGTEISDFGGNRPLGFAVGAFTGLLHGGKAMLDTRPPFSTLAPWDDPMNAPFVDDVFKDAAAIQPGVGDLFLPELLGSPGDSFAPQRRALFGCAVSGLRAVYGATAQRHGAMQSTDTSAIDLSRSVDDGSCWDQRATNRALAAGMGIHLGAFPNQTPLSAQAMTPLIFAITNVLPTLGGSEALDPATKEAFNRDAAFAATLALAKGMDPTTANDADLADGGLPPLAGVFPNSAYARGDAATRVAPSPYADPFPPFKLKESNSSLSRRMVPLNLTFADANAFDRCNELTGADLDGYREAVSAARAGGAPSDVMAARCGQCVQLIAPHIRYGTSSLHDPRREALCGVIAPSSAAFAYTGEDATTFTGQEAIDRASLEQTARKLCGCEQFQVAAGTYNNAVSGTTGTALLARVRTPTNALVSSPVTLTVQGPPGWNGGAAASLSYPAGLQRQFYAHNAPPLSGTYTVTTTVEGQTLTATSTIDASVVMSAPANVTANLVSVPNAVGSSWTPVALASSYLTRIFDFSAQRIRFPVAYTNATNASLVGVSIEGGNQNALQVWAFSSDMRPADPVVPAQFNLSFNREVLTSSITLSPASSQIIPGSSGSVGLTATLTNLPPGVTWSGAYLSGSSGNSVTLSPPPVDGNYAATATSTANPSFRATASVKVTGASSCSPVNTGTKFAGTWDVAGGGFGVNCGTGAFAEFNSAGVLTISNNGSVSVTYPAGIRGYAGGVFVCSPSEAMIGPVGNFQFALGSLSFLDDTNAMRGTITLRHPLYNTVIPCVTSIVGTRR